ncbi:PE family protein [Mycobacterium palustre]|nr:PE family protein [Mycobacterium palustre]MCV7098842.1 PE family protein [Mycobacterium palustre]
MSFVTTVPDAVQAAAQDLAGVRASLADAAANAEPLTGIAAAAEDEISIAIASLFGGAGQQFQALNAQARAFHAEFERLLSAGAAAYVSAEAANAGVLAGGAPAAAAPAAAVQTFTLYGGIVNFQISQSGILVTLGTPGIVVPEVNINPISLSAFDLPRLTIPSINIPAGTTPPNVTLSPFSLPQITIPAIDIPAGATPPGVTVGGFSLPQITTPAISVPSINLPAVDIPQFQTPRIALSDWSLPTVTIPGFNFPRIQLPDINITGGSGDVTVLSLETSNIVAPNYDIVLHGFDFAPSFGFNTLGSISTINFPGIQIGQFQLPILTIGNPSGSGDYLFPSIGLSGFSISSITIPPIDVSGFTLPQVSWPGFATAPLTIPPIAVGDFALPQLSWPAFATPPLTIPPVGVGAFDLPHIHIPNTTIEPIQIGQFRIPPATSYVSALQSNTNALLAELAFVGTALTGVGTI